MTETNRTNEVIVGRAGTRTGALRTSADPSAPPGLLSGDSATFPSWNERDALGFFSSQVWKKETGKNKRRIIYLFVCFSRWARSGIASECQRAWLTRGVVG